MHPKAQLTKILATLPNPSLSGYFYRSVDNFSLYSFNPPNPLYNLSPGRTGQRYTPMGGPPALYVADKANTAFAEGTHSITSSLAGTIAPPAPVVIYAVKVNLEHILDLTDNAVLNALDTTVAELQGSWENQVAAGVCVPTHLLAETAYKTHRFQGMLFNSKESPRGINLIIWTNKVRTPSSVEVYDPTGKLAARIPKKRR
jgi:RES domain-containing protein